MDERITEIRKHLKKKLNPMRYEHTLPVPSSFPGLS